MAEPVADMVAEIARELVDAPDEVRVEVEEDDRGVTIALQVAEDDMGRVIGRGGRVAHSLRVLVRAASRRRGERARLEIVD